MRLATNEDRGGFLWRRLYAMSAAERRGLIDLIEQVEGQVRYDRLVEVRNRHVVAERQLDRASREP